MFNRNLVFAAACLGMAFFGVAFIVMGSVLPALTERFALDSVGASSVVTFLPVGVLLGSLLFGPVVDRWGYKMLLIASGLITIAGLEGLSWGTDFAFLRGCVFCIGLGGGMLNGATNALASDVSTDEDRSSRLSLLGVCYGVGALIVPMLLGTLSEYFSYSVILRWTGGVMLVCVIWFLAVRFPAPKFRQGFPFRQAVSLLRQPVLPILGFFLFLQSGMEGLTNNWSTSYLQATTNIAGGDVVLALTFCVLGMTLARLALSFIFRRVGQDRVLLGAMAVALAGMVLLNFSSGWGGSAASLFLIGAGLSAGFPVAVSLIGSAFRETSGTAIGIALFLALAGNSLLNYAIGWISRKWGIESLPLFLAILLVIQFVIAITNKKIINPKN
jgi:fucose permease